MNIAESPDTLFFKEKKIKLRVYCADIVFFESSGHNISIHMRDGSIHVMRTTVAKLAESMDKKFFVRVHRAYIVNLRYVYKVNSDKLCLYGKWGEIPIGRTYKQHLNDAFIDFEQQHKQHP